MFELLEQAEQTEEAIPMVRESAQHLTPIHLLKCYLKALFDKDVHAAARQDAYRDSEGLLLLPGGTAGHQQECHDTNG